MLWGQPQQMQWDVLWTQNMNWGQEVYDVTKDAGIKWWFSTCPSFTLGLCPTFHSFGPQATSKTISLTRTIQQSTVAWGGESGRWNGIFPDRRGGW